MSRFFNLDRILAINSDACSSKLRYFLAVTLSSLLPHTSTTPEVDTGPQLKPNELVFYTSIDVQKSRTPKPSCMHMFLHRK